MKKKKRVLNHKEQRRAAEARRLQKKDLLQKELEEIEDSEIDPEIDMENVLKSDTENLAVNVPETGGEPETEPIEKDGMYEVPVSPIVGATSWDELEQVDADREKMAEVQAVAWKAQDLVYNILAVPDMGIEEKGKAIQEVGAGFVTRAQAILEDADESEGEEKEKDLDLLSAEALQAYDRRHASWLDMLKAAVSYGAREDMPDSNFALVVTRDGKKIRKYLIHDKSHVRNALARAAQQIKAGGQGAADAKAALSKIRAAAKKFGIDVTMKKEQNGIVIEKDASGNWRWVGWVSNNFIDWDGDIISEDAHKEYVEWLDKNMNVAPRFLTWHTPGTARKAPVDFAAFENGFLIMSGPLENSEAGGLMKASKSADLGMSHGSFVMERDPKDRRVITKYRMYEVSDLPLENAANPFTNLETIVKEVDMDKKKYLAEILGSEELAQQFMDKAGLKQAELREAEIPEKEKADVPEGDPPKGETPPAPVPDAISAPEKEDVVARVLKEMDIEGLNAFVSQAQEAMEKVPVLEALIKEMQASIKDAKVSDDEKLAEKLTPPVARFAWSQENRPTADESNVVKKSDQLVKQAPGVPDGYWLSALTGTAPVKEEVK